MGTNLTTEIFIKKSIKKHGNKYDYSKVNYKSSIVEVEIICHTHGIFFQKPYVHLRGGGCSKCIRRLNTKEFIKLSKKIHKNKFDYSKVDYIKNNIKVIITCPTHGDFLQQPHNHLSGFGCRECGKEILKNSRISNTNEFVKKAKKIHKNKYIYSKVNYVNNRVNVIIVCPIHGDFLQKPDNHLHKMGCYKCGIESLKNKLLSNTNQFIKSAKKVHKNKFDYSKVDYTNNSTPVIIICKKHGEFNQKPAEHLQGNCCPNCHTSKGENKISSFLDDNKIIYIKEAKFSECKHISLLKFDFYLPNYNLCIEFDGIQHFDKTTRWYNKLIPIRDAIKTKFCRDNDINLIRIHYKDLDNVEQILSEYLKINVKQISSNFI
jgi:very-short-patch-repair endonuclease